MTTNHGKTQSDTGQKKWKTIKIQSNERDTKKHTTDLKRCRRNKNYVDATKNIRARVRQYIKSREVVEGLI